MTPNVVVRDAPKDVKIVLVSGPGHTLHSLWLFVIEHIFELFPAETEATVIFNGASITINRSATYAEVWEAYEAWRLTVKIPGLADGVVVTLMQGKS